MVLRLATAVRPSSCHTLQFQPSMIQGKNTWQAARGRDNIKQWAGKYPGLLSNGRRTSLQSENIQRRGAWVHLIALSTTTKSPAHLCPPSIEKTTLPYLTDLRNKQRFSATPENRVRYQTPCRLCFHSGLRRSMPLVAVFFASWRVERPRRDLV